MSAEAVLQVREVTKTFGQVRAVDRLSFAVARGTITGLLGRNGAGKTTTLRMINGIFLPDAGSDRAVRRRGRGRRSRPDRLPPRGARPLPQDARLRPAPLPGRDQGAAARRGADAGRAWLKRFDLWDKRAGKLEELSKGNQQKVQLIGALLHDPEVVILDEPMSGLDPVNVVLVRTILKELKAEGRTILLSTHMMGEAEKLVDEIVLIHEGRAVLAGELEQVRASFGTNTVHLGFEGDGAFLSGLPGVAAGAGRHQRRRAAPRARAPTRRRS